MPNTPTDAMLPLEIINAARLVHWWFAEQGIKTWELMNICSRDHADAMNESHPMNADIISFNDWSKTEPGKATLGADPKVYSNNNPPLETAALRGFLAGYAAGREAKYDEVMRNFATLCGRKPIAPV